MYMIKINILHMKQHLVSFFISFWYGTFQFSFLNHPFEYRLPPHQFTWCENLWPLSRWCRSRSLWLGDPSPLSWGCWTKGWRSWRWGAWRTWLRCKLIENHVNHGAKTTSPSHFWVNGCRYQNREVRSEIWHDKSHWWPVLEAVRKANGRGGSWQSPWLTH